MSYVFLFELTSIFLRFVFQVQLNHANAYANMQHVGPIRSSPKEKLAHYIRRMYDRW
jgi:hypothetical protein